jgi:hypothetical protein
MEFVNEKLTSGRSLGRASTSQHFYQNPQVLSEQFETQQLYSLTLDEELRQVLARYQITQWANPFERDWQTEYSQNSTSAAAIEALTGMLQNRAAVQGMVIIEHAGRTASYALTPVALEEVGGMWKVWVYNSNFDAGTPQGYEYIQVDLAQDKHGQWRWIKNDGSVLSGDDTTHTFYVVPLDMIYGPQEFVTHTAESSNDQVWGNGNANVLITNEAGERIGYVGGKFVNEIDGASAMPVVGGSQQPSMPVFNLPSAGVYTIELEELAGPARPEASIGYFSAQSVITVSGIDLSSGAKDTLTLEASGSSLIYHSQAGQSLSVVLVFDEASQSLRMAWNEIALPSGGQFELSTDVASQEFTYTQSSPGTYSLDVNSSSSDGEKVFKHSAIEIPAGVWHTYALSRWERNGMFWVFIDEDGDGKQDGDLKLQNQTTGIGEEAVGGKLGMALIILGAGFLLAAAGLGGLAVYLRRVKRY